MLGNGTAKPIHLASVRLIERTVAANAIPDTIISPELEKKLTDEDGEKPKPLTTEECQKLLIEVLEKEWKARQAGGVVC